MQLIYRAPVTSYERCCRPYGFIQAVAVTSRQLSVLSGIKCLSPSANWRNLLSSTTQSLCTKTSRCPQIWHYGRRMMLYSPGALTVDIRCELKWTRHRKEDLPMKFRGFQSFSGSCRYYVAAVVWKWHSVKQVLMFRVTASRIHDQFWGKISGPFVCWS